MHLGHLAIFVLDGRILINCEDFQCSKVSLSVVLWRLSLVGNWCSFFFKRKKVEELTRAIETLTNKSVRNKKLNRIIYVVNVIFVLTLLLYLYLVIKGSIGIVLWPNTKRINKVFSRLFSGVDYDLGQTGKAACIYLFHFFTWPFIYFSPLLLSLFYASWCFILSKQLKELGDQLLKELPQSGCHRRRIVIVFIKNYEELYDLAVLSEAALSSQVFWLCSSHFVLLFRLFSKLWLTDTYIPVTLVKDSVLPTLESLCFFAIAYFASEVNYCDLAVRDRAKDVAFRLELAKETKECGKVLSKFLKSKKVLMFSGWGMFDFTRGFLLASSGVLLSYNLLILQLNTHI
ncbi:hypothetical protein JTE90_009222 [Oedothorax gibbosus]|uniref:Gustatory receptor n=1 Tax=Oedothorax gibbosus TaxID=931172 RepID=A0AAV6URW9_9ARAC|nr:hypothetical protein JTE90_009222 [Oedothorax gibbosus]